MPNVVITAANVLADANARTPVGVAGETITAGQVLYFDPADSRWRRADALTALKAGSANPSFIKVALSGGSVGQTIALLDNGQDYTVGGTLVVGTTYVVSATAGGGNIAPEADLVATNFYTRLGYAISTARMRFNPDPTGLQK